MTNRVSLLAFVLFLLIPSAVRADTIWEKARLGTRIEERQTRVSIEKVLSGSGDERDLLRVRVGLITLSRGEIDDPRTIVLLLRMRREMGLSQTSGAMIMLEKAQQGDLSLTERAWAELELAHTYIFRGNLSEADEALTRGLDASWRSEVRAETLLLRGLVRLRLGDDDRALSDYQSALGLSVPRRLAVQAHIGRAQAYALRGDDVRVLEEARHAFVIESTRASVSRLDPFWDLNLAAYEKRAARALLRYGASLALEVENPAQAHATRLEACALVPGLPPDSRTRDGGRPWGLLIAQTLSAMWSDACQAPPPLAAGNDENDL